jgi:integrase
VSRPVQRVQVFAVQSRRGSARVKLPFVVRYAIDGRHRSKSFRTKAEAERYRIELLKAAHGGDRFDESTGEPESWLLPLSESRVHEWARRWLASQWAEWQPRTRSSTTESLSRLVALAIVDRSVTPDGLRRYLRQALRADRDVQADDVEFEVWMERNCLTLGELTRERMAVIAHDLNLKLDGSPLAAATANRYRTNCHDCVLAAVDAGAFAVDPWPRRSRKHASRKVARRKRAIDVHRLPAPDTMARAIDAIASSNPASRTYQMMTATAYYAGLRPSEVIMLRLRSLKMPDRGWGRVDVREADIDWDEPGEPKTGPRSVPIPPILVRMLRSWVTDRALIDPEQLLFRTRTGARPSESTWRRAWIRALDTVGQPPLRVYDCRHAAATTWLRAGVPLGEVARRMGHNVQTLVSTYVGALDGDEAIGNQRIEAVLSVPPPKSG